MIAPLGPDRVEQRDHVGDRQLGRVVGRVVRVPAATVPAHVPRDHRVVRSERRDVRGEHVAGRREAVRQQQDGPAPATS